MGFGFTYCFTPLNILMMMMMMMMMMMTIKYIDLITQLVEWKLFFQSCQGGPGMAYLEAMPPPPLFRVFGLLNPTLSSHFRFT